MGATVAIAPTSKRGQRVTKAPVMPGGSVTTGVVEVPSQTTLFEPPKRSIVS